jgi:beta-glucanase (GH16 family)
VEGRWQRVWADEFDGAAGSQPDPETWRLETEINTGGFQRWTDDPANAHAGGRGHMVISALERAPYRYSSGRLTTEGLFEFRYGRIAARIKVPAGQGLWPTFGLMGADLREVGWPECGEIGVMGVFGHRPRRLMGAVHGPLPGEISTNVGGRHDARDSLADAFHVFGVRWRENAVLYTFDGKLYGVVHRKHYPRQAPWIFQRPVFTFLQLATGGRGVGYPDETTRFPARMKVDWVRVWQRRD